MVFWESKTFYGLAIIFLQIFLVLFSSLIWFFLSILLMIEGNEEKFGFVEYLYWNLIGLCCFANGFAKRLLFDQRLEMHFVSDRSDPKTGLCVIWMEIQNSFKLARSFQRLCINQVSKTGNVHTIFIIVCWLMIPSSSMKSFYTTEKPMKYEVL